MKRVFQIGAWLMLVVSICLATSAWYSVEVFASVRLQITNPASASVLAVMAISHAVLAVFCAVIARFLQQEARSS